MLWVRRVKYPRRSLLLDCRYESGLWDTEKTRALAHQRRVLWGVNFPGYDWLEPPQLAESTTEGRLGEAARADTVPSNGGYDDVATQRCMP